MTTPQITKARMIPKKLLAIVFLALSAATLAACGGDDKRPTSPRGRSGNLPPMLRAAFKEEAMGTAPKAVDLYFGVLDAAATSDEDPWAVPVAMAALDALVHRTSGTFSEVSGAGALTDRVPAASLPWKKKSFDDRLAEIEEHAGGFVKPLVATARLALAERRSDARSAAVHRAHTACVRESLLAGPVSWSSVSGVRDVSAFGNVAPAEVPGPGPFAPKVAPVKIASFGCHIPLYAQTNTIGVRDVVIDVDVPKAGVIGVSLRSSSAATLRAGGVLAIDRAYSAGGGNVVRFARVKVTKSGVLRLVARAGMEQDFASIDVAAIALPSGEPLRARAGATGQRADATAADAAPLVAPSPKTDDEKLASALGSLAARDHRAADALLHPDVARPDAPPDLLLTYARAVRAVRDLPTVKSNERARAAIERALEAWPSSWEAAVEHAALAGARRGPAEANLEALADLDKTRANGKQNQTSVLDAYEAQTAARERLYDRAVAAFEKIKGPLAGTPLLREIDRLTFERTGREAAAFECDESSPSDRTTLACYNARVSLGDRDGSEKELDRLRAVSGTPQLYLSLSSRNALEVGDLARAGKLLEAMNPGDRPLATLYAVKGKAAVPDLFRLAPSARDAPHALAPLLRDAGDNPIAGFEGIAEKVTSDQTIGALVKDAATAVLAHTERYDVDANGVVHFVMLDVRRVMGTADVESNAQASAPSLYGKDSVRILRRRIIKKDGRIVLPDRTPHASQSHADLSQLEAGDAVEAIYEGWGLPGETNNIGIDTPDLLPERVAIREAKIEIRFPADLKTSLWSHSLLGKPEDRLEGTKRVLVWNVKDRPVRHVEVGVPKMDRSVMVSFSTTTWADVARGIRETIAALDADHPEVSAWAKEAAGGKPVSPALVESIVAASGTAVKEASGVVLTDLDLGRPASGQSITARSILATHEGSRTWLIVRALRELGVKVDIVVAENEPFSDSASFPPHFGRFMHPLAVAHVPDPQKPGTLTDIWIDADVSGPPRPAGRISPELRGRNAIFPDGKIAPLPIIGAGAERDEIDIRLVVDEQGSAKGSLTVLLRGRSAQDLSEALIRIVGLERQRALRGIALAWVPFATVDKVELSSSEGSWQVAIRAELTAPAFAQLEGTKPGSRMWILPGIDPIHYVFPRPYVSTLGSSYASHAARENALAINHATQYHVRRKIELPPKAQVARVPGPFEGKGPLLSAQRKTNVNGNSIEEDFTLEVTTGTVPRDRYDQFVAEAHRTDDAFRASTRVKPPVP